MSSILRALKKLESELPHPTDTLPLPRKLDTKKTISRRARRIKRSNVLLMFASGAIVLTAIIWFISGQRIHQSREPAPDATLTKRYVSVIPTAAAPEPKTKTMPPTSVPKIKDTGQRRVKGADKLLTQALTPSTVSPDKAQGKSETAAIPVTSRKTDQRLRAVTPIGDTRLKLQAISWDKNSEKRIAVINNRIVREGESVDGFLITIIGKDDVLVREGENEWKLMFSFK